MSVLRGLLGIVVVLGIAFLFSKDKRRIRLRPILTGLGLMFVFAFLVMGTGWGAAVLEAVSNGVSALMDFAREGIDFVFGGLYTEESGITFVVAFDVLPQIIFFASLIAVLYHLGIMQVVTRYIGGGIRRIMGTSRAESISAASNIFVGHTEAPLTVKPYLARMSRSELFTVMVGGLASVAGTMLAAYIALGIPAEYVLAAMFMAAPAGIVIAKTFYPEVEETSDAAVLVSAARSDGTTGAADAAEGASGEDAAEAAAGQEAASSGDGDAQPAEPEEEREANLIDAAATGARTGLTLALTVGAILLAFVALIAVVNGAIAAVGGLFGVETSLQEILGFVLSPLAFALGVPWAEAVQAGSFIGEKFILTEFIAFTSLSEAAGALSAKTVAVVSFALCGFANLGSMGSLIGVLGSLAPGRKKEVARLALKSVFAGMLASMLSAAIVGMFF
ncbi:nucleoside transporter C-terminal domain-containing protein [Brevibacterium sp.]|uniref:NupC/NupG family nucleoside CNT transporter n=1 Tax=Brevibacterium sp. TaxID=1701 RepID=UPI0025BEAD04|nr:nucleoside transporter C-terminal domain-containing protein [Brevibacterium sp.]